MQDARSQVIRDGVWEWFNGAVYNRLQPGVLIPDDVAHQNEMMSPVVTE